MAKFCFRKFELHHQTLELDIQFQFQFFFRDSDSISTELMMPTQ